MSLEPICLYIRTSFTGCLEGAHAWTLSFLLHSRGKKATSIRGHLEHFPSFSAMCSYMITHSSYSISTQVHTCIQGIAPCSKYLEKIRLKKRLKEMEDLYGLFPSADSEVGKGGERETQNKTMREEKKQCCCRKRGKWRSKVRRREKGRDSEKDRQ